MQIARFKIQCLPIAILVAVGVLVWLVSSGGVATAGYGDTAHGDTTSGVNRSGTGYPTGSCAHCHDTLDSSICGQNKLMLFYDDFITRCDLICYECHKVSGNTVQVVYNYPYSYNFGGSGQYYGSIYGDFCKANSAYANCGSRHWLNRIYTIIRNNGYGWGFPDDPNPCSACHNPHLAQRMGGQYRPPYDLTKSSITRPSERYNNPLNLWGDETGADPPERMNEYALSVGGTYQAPYYGSFGSGQYEPSGNASPSDGSDLPNYVTFCLDCHQYQQWDPERSAWCKAINWGSDGDKHGGRVAGDGDCCTSVWAEGDLRAPYDDDRKEAGDNYVLSCTDCHEPHGTKNKLHLIRRYVNGELVAKDTGSCDDAVDWEALCQRCHTNHGLGICWDCHGHGSWYNCYPLMPSCDQAMF